MGFQAPLNPRTPHNLHIRIFHPPTPPQPTTPPTHPSSDPPFQVKRVEELLQQELGRHPTEEEVAARSGMSWAKLNYLHKWVENEALGCLGDVLG